jgi:CO/xanthine dehydrogenase FAD-binding subunit
MYAEFDLHVPSDLPGALDVLAANDDAILPLAGGTNLIVDLRARSAAPTALVGLGNVPELRGIHMGTDRVRMGGATTVSDLLRTGELAALAPSLVESARVFAGQMVRNTATVAGNLCYGSPAADLVPPLLALDTDVTLTSRAGTRTLALEDFFLDYRKTARRADELLTELSWPLATGRATNLFYKLARRKGDAITVVGVAVAMGIQDDTCRGVRIALGAVAPVVLRATAAERVLEGRTPTAKLIDEAADAAVDATSPIDDIRASADYRRHSVRVLTRRLLTRAWEELRGEGASS